MISGDTSLNLLNRLRDSKVPFFRYADRGWNDMEIDCMVLEKLIFLYYAGFFECFAMWQKKKNCADVDG